MLRNRTIFHLGCVVQWNLQKKKKNWVNPKKCGGGTGSFKQVTNVPSLNVSFFFFFPVCNVPEIRKKSKTHASISMIVSGESKG